MLENEIIDYKQHEQEICYWINLKGEYRYQAIIDFMKKNDIKCSWNNVTYYIKYDKRILINSFKYIVFLEELYKSFVKQNKNVKQSELLRYGFKKALDEYLSIGDKANFDDIDLKLLIAEKDTINLFRNNVVHNKILLNNSYNGKTLEEVLNIFVKILPKSYRTGYIHDMNSCSKGITDTTWHIEIKE